MARNVYNNDMVAHVWAQQQQQSGRSSNGQFYFEGATIYSYGSHFPIARFVEHKGARAVLFTTQSRSVTTSAHCGRARSALHGLGLPVFSVDGVLSNDHKVRREQFSANVEALAIAAVRKRASNAQWAMQTATDAAHVANTYAEFYGLRWRVKVPTFSAEFIEATKAKAAADVKRKAEATRKKTEADLKAWAQTVAEWRAGALARLPWQADRLPTMLRINGDVIQTSRGAEFPVEHGKRAFAFIARCKTQGTEWRTNGHKIPLGNFKIDMIQPSGDVIAGCHQVPWIEIEACARALGLEA